ncbi:MAG: ADP-ribosylglycohydrolase family protein, partial [Cyanobacteria bacterium]|nr:ADP-ribosylglycohydrolase family protein [Cyanobacteriota bacterium]
MKFSLLSKTAKGDAYGAGFEYGSDGFVTANNDVSRFVRHERHKLEPGVYTDDTQMALAISEVIVGESPLSRETLAEMFVKAFKRDQREGYASGFYNFLCGVVDAPDFLARMVPVSDKSGAAMRAVPIGIYSDIEKVKELSRLQASLTHNTTDGINAAIAASLMGHYFIYGLGRRADLGKWLEKHVKGDNCKWATPWTGKVGAQGWMSVRAAVTAVVANNSLKKMLQDCIAFTGDVDTVAAVALGAAWASSEVTDDLPSFLSTDLENGTYGRDYLAGIDSRLE